MKAYRHTFQVAAPSDTEFPLDMLRYDSCYPVTSDDLGRMRDPALTARTITLRHVGPKEWRPSDRWRTFGWRVVEHESEVWQG